MTAEAALACLSRGDAEGAFAMLDQKADRSDASWHAARGMIQLALGDADTARTSLQTAIRLGDISPAILLNLALADDRLGRTETARRVMQALTVQLPEWDEPALRLAESLRAGGQHADAEDAYRQVLEINPRRIEALVALGGLLILRGQGAEARDRLLCCCGMAPDRAEAWDALGLALLLTKEPSQALAAFGKAQRLSPHSLDYAMHGVEAALAAGETTAELARLEVACEADPVNPALHVARGALLERLGQRAAAIDALDIAAALAPEESAPAIFLGRVLARSSRLKEADKALQRAATLDPENAQIRNDRAAVLMRMHRHAEARALLLDLIKRHGPHPSVLCNLANATACLGLQQEAVDLARQAIALDPDAVLPRRALCNTMPYLDGVTGGGLLSALQDCAARLPRAGLLYQGPPGHATEPFSNTPDPVRRLTVGLLSGTLKTHPVGWLTVAGFETLDQSAFRLVCLAPDLAPGDPIAQRFRSASEDWIDTDPLDDQALVRKARELGLDILIDLGGYGDGARMIACANRLAPVQIKWVGMQNHSTGLPEMDWFVTDRWETPPGLEHLYSERLLRMPDGYVCYARHLMPRTSARFRP